MMKNKNRRKKVTVLVIILVLLSIALTRFDSNAFTNVRNVDIAIIFACGMLVGVLILTIKDIIWERKDV